MIWVFQERHCKPGKEAALLELLTELRTKAMQRPGYVSGETLKGVELPECYLVASRWTRLEAWKNWEDSRERREILQMISPLLWEEPKISIYTVLEEE